MSTNKRWLLIVALATAWAWYAGLGATAQGQEILYFTADWCVPCQHMAPMIEQLERDGIVFHRIDPKQSRAFADQFSVTTIPVFVALDAKRVPVSEIRHATDEKNLRAMWAKVSAKVTTIPDELRRSIIRVSNHLPGGRASLATGTIVDDQEGSTLILTCAHLFDEGRGRVTVSVAGSEYETLVADIDQKLDLLALEVKKRLQMKPVPIAASDPKPGDALVAAGYGGTENLSTRPAEAQGYITLMGGIRNASLQLSGGAQQGDSGGPILDANYHLVGVTHGTNGKVTDGTCCYHIRPFLQRVRARIRTRLYGVQDAVVPGLKNPPAANPRPIPGPAPDVTLPPDEAATLAPIPAPPSEPTVPATALGRLRADLEAKAAADLQAATKQLRDDLGKQIGVSEGLQKIIDAKATELEATLAEKAKHSAAADKARADLAALDEKFRAKVAEVTGGNQTIGELRDKPSGALSQVATHQGVASDLKSKLDAALPELARLKAAAGAAGLPALDLGILGPAITAAAGTFLGPAGWAAMAAGGIGLLGRWSKGINLKNLGAGAVLGAATAGNPAVAPPQSPQIAIGQQFYPVVQPQTANEVAMQQALAEFVRQNPNQINIANQLDSFRKQFLASLSKGKTA